jgi:hypothetical protein
VGSLQVTEWPLSEVTQGRRRGVASGDLCIRMVGLCYDTPSVEARLFLVAFPEKPPWALSEDFFQETFLGVDHRVGHCGVFHMTAMSLYVPVGRSPSIGRKRPYTIGDSADVATA